MMHGPINIIKQVTSVGLSLFNYQDDARSNKHKETFYSVKNWNFQHAPRNPENVRREHTILRNYYLLRVVIPASECKYKSRNSKNNLDIHIGSGKLTKT